jgi:ribonuclease D
MTVITDTDTLRAFCERMSHEPFITLDTEFLREKTYWPQLCLVQIGGATEAAAIDPLAGAMDLKPLYDLLANEKVLKVLHAARQDMEIFHQSMGGKLPTPVFDTQIAAQVAGLGESVGYEALVKQLLGQSIDKSQRYTDWSRRPLSASQIEYALGDVTYLRDAYLKLIERITKNNRREWIAQEMAEIANPAIYLLQPDEAWKRIKMRASHPRQLGRLKAFAAWREALAQAEDLPRVRIVRDEVLVEMAVNLPKDEGEMDRIRGFPGHLKREWRKQLWEICHKVADLPKEDCPPLPKHDPLPPQAEGRLEMLRMLLKQCARDADVTPRMVADKDDLEWLARGSFLNGATAPNPTLRASPCSVGGSKESPTPHVPCLALTGWRHEVFGKHALGMLQGKLAICLHPQTGDIIFTEC